MLLQYLDFDFSDEELQGTIEPDTALPLAYDERRGAVSPPSVPADALVTLTFTVSGSPAFCEGLREAFALD